MTKARDIADGQSVDTTNFVTKANGAIEALDGSALTNLTADNLDDTGTIPSQLLADVGGENTPAFRAYLDTNQGSVNAGQNTKILLDAVDHDTDNGFSTSTSQFTVPTAGTYLLYGSVQTNSSEDFDDYQVNIVKNSTTSLARQRIRHHYADTPNVTTTAVLAVGDTIELQMYNGASTSKTAQASIQGTFLGGFKLAE